MVHGYLVSAIQYYPRNKFFYHTLESPKNNDLPQPLASEHLTGFEKLDVFQTFEKQGTPETTRHKTKFRFQDLATNAYKSEYPNRISQDTFMNLKKSCYCVNLAKISLILFCSRKLFPAFFSQLFNFHKLANNL